MLAPPSSLIDPAIGHLVDVAQDVSAERPGLLVLLARVADPRHRRGVRHRLAGILGLALCAMVAGAPSFTAIAEWAADADGHALRMLRITGECPRNRRSGGPAAPGRQHLDASSGSSGRWLTPCARLGNVPPRRAGRQRGNSRSRRSGNAQVKRLAKGCLVGLPGAQCVRGVIWAGQQAGSSVARAP